ncbi:MAG: S8 family serine peptidase, partial [Verrucomicrobiota bacterium]|nr:S8 family serine peptidase [Verrucomicrobiota bacterium]
TMNGWGGAKNVLTVGAVNDLVGGYTNAAGVALASFSSFGPMDDGRLKPDVVANGVNVITTADASDASYFYPNGPNGTSFAAPSVTGSIDLLAERYGQLHPNARRLQGATLKALVIHTADECGPALGPDYAFGWGLMNTRTAADLLGLNATNGWKAYVKEVLLQPADYIEFPVVVSGNTNTLKVTICWADPAGTPPATGIDPTNRMLINDLDLRVFSPSGSTNFPWVLNPDLVNKSAATRGAPATKSDNVLDNVEQVMITNATAGTYTVRITHKGTNLCNGLPQWVSVLTTGQTPQAKPPLQITGIAVTGSEEVTLQWTAVVGQRYQVQYRDNVEGPGWTNIAGEVSAMRTDVSAALPFSPSQPQRFYRIAEVE